jgi:hypothetical protein
MLKQYILLFIFHFIQLNGQGILNFNPNIFKVTYFDDGTSITYVAELKTNSPKAWVAWVYLLNP